MDMQMLYTYNGSYIFIIAEFKIATTSKMVAILLENWYFETKQLLAWRYTFVGATKWRVIFFYFYFNLILDSMTTFVKCRKKSDHFSFLTFPPKISRMDSRD